ncbi:MAG: DUF4145 domain-containing protein [Clostridia bacterium]|nr:DUF4145 domain-containing protein [Clostridia bacterium]
MERNKELINLIANKKSAILYNEETICPICKSAISPVYISSCLNKNSIATIINYCTACQDVFITTYSLTRSGKSTGTTDVYSSNIIKSEPNLFKEEVFDEKIKNLSPQFVKIYNQALAAESSGLDEIAGIGYRKSLEFLVKDFAISENSDKVETIKSMQLAQCIKTYIANSQIAILAERSAWIGNDETHYIRKQENRDVNDMKAFIKAIVYFIGMFLIAKDAASMLPK